MEPGSPALQVDSLPAELPVGGRNVKRFLFFVFFFLIGVVMMWAYTFVKIGQILQLECMHFITCKLHFN